MKKYLERAMHAVPVSRHACEWGYDGSTVQRAKKRMTDPCHDDGAEPQELDG
jgi:hypothetical protein